MEFNLGDEFKYGGEVEDQRFFVLWWELERIKHRTLFPMVLHGSRIHSSVISEGVV